MRPVTLAALLTLAAITPATAAPRFDAIAFFTGHTEGVATMKIVLRDRRAVRVHGFGAVAPDGTLILAQTVEQEGRPPKKREWRLRAVAPGRYTGTLSDARGDIAGEASGDRLHLWYRTEGGIAVDQWLVLSADGRSAQNLLTARMAGMTIARLDETIRKTD